MSRIIGIDPGKTTGLVLYDGHMLVEAKEETDPFKVAQYVITKCPMDVIVEDFILLKKASNAKDPLRIIHFVEYVCGIEGIDMHLQSPSILSIMKKRIPKDGPSPHTHSAQCHVEYFLKMRKEHMKGG